MTYNISNADTLSTVAGNSISSNALTVTQNISSGGVSTGGIVTVQGTNNVRNITLTFTPSLNGAQVTAWKCTASPAESAFYAPTACH
jgi:hypothetical protein